MFLRVCPDSQEAPESQEKQEVRSDNISNHSSFPKQGSMTSLTPDELIIMMSGRQHESGEGEDEEQRKGRWKRNQEESGRSGSASDEGRREGFLQVGERRRSAPERRMKVS